MDLTKKDLFIQQWKRYFNEAELPITFYYASHAHDVPEVEHPDTHRCIISQLSRVRKGESICFTPHSLNCRGGAFYLGFANSMRPRFEQFLSHGEENEPCERYKKSPQLVRQLLTRFTPLQKAGDFLICKRWDQLTEADCPAVVCFFATPDVIAGLVTLVSYDYEEEDAVITPFGAGCTSLFYLPYREGLSGKERAVMGLFDPSARKCAKKELLTFSVPIRTFMRMIENMEESFLITNTWEVIQRRIQ